MPQLDTLTYLSQYTWTLIIIFILLVSLLNKTIPRIQQQLAIRSQLDNIQFKRETSKIEILKTLFRL